MRYKVQGVVQDDQGNDLRTQDVATLEKGWRPIERIGLRLHEAKGILRNLQQILDRDQVRRYLEGAKHCAFGAPLAIKGHRTIVLSDALREGAAMSTISESGLLRFYPRRAG